MIDTAEFAILGNLVISICGQVSFPKMSSKVARRLSHIRASSPASRNHQGKKRDQFIGVSSGVTGPKTNTTVISMAANLINQPIRAELYCDGNLKEEGMI